MKPKRLVPIKFRFVKQESGEANIAITRVGGHAGKIWFIGEILAQNDRFKQTRDGVWITNLMQLSPSTHYFINCDIDLFNLLIEQKREIVSESINHVMGARSLDKPTLISELNEV